MEKSGKIRQNNTFILHKKCRKKSVKIITLISRKNVKKPRKNVQKIPSKL